MAKRTWVILLLVGLILTGTAVAGPRGAESSSAITFSDQIASIIYSNCTTCHREGEAGPFSLVSFADARRHAKEMVDVTSRRVMPPWKAQHGELEFIGERRLADDQIETIRRWVAGGCTQGDPATAPKPPQFTSGWQLGEPDMVVIMPQPYALAAEGPDEYRCFVIPLKIPPGKYIKSVEYRPGNRKIVHHAVLTMLPHDLAAAQLEAGDGKSFSSGLAPPGQRLPGPLGIWTPGMEPQPLPDGFAARWPQGVDLVLQLHLHPSGKIETERSSVGFHFTDEAPRARLRSVIFMEKKIDIAPGDSNYAIDNSLILPAAVDAYGIFPHMHLLGRTIKVTATLPDGSRHDLLSIGDWEFKWQNYYQYATPVRLPAGTQLSTRWTYDNSAANPANPGNPPRRVVFGEQTTDEMAALVLDVIPLKADAQPSRRANGVAQTK